MYNPMVGVGQGVGGGIDCQDNCVLMVYGLVCERMTCTKLFNLLCLYGNVIRIKFLKSKDGSAMVQMGDREGCERACRLLNDSKLYGSKIQISFSKQPYLQPVLSPFTMFDGSPSFMDFSTNRNNRYTTPGAAAKIRITGPTNILYFYNAPHSLDESTLIQTFLDAGTTVPVKTNMLPAKSEKSSRGCVYFEDVEGASEALMVINNSKIKNPSAPGGAPYVLKLTFYQAPAIM
jgi:heterogeneous nuclear ribonucleoprotein L